MVNNITQFMRYIINLFEVNTDADTKLEIFKVKYSKRKYVHVE